jgi:hypothetical protein
MRKGERKRPDIYNDPLLAMSPEDKNQLRTILVSPVYVKLMRFVERYRPSSNCPKAGTQDRDQFSNDRANARLAEMRGWDLHVASIFSALSDVTLSKTETEPTYPDNAALNIGPKEIKE